MNEKTIERCRNLLYILEAPENLRRDLLDNCSDKIVLIFCEVSLNLLFGDLQVGIEETDILKFSKPLLSKIAKEKGTVKGKRKLINELEPHAIDLIRSILMRYV